MVTATVVTYPPFLSSAPSVAPPAHRGARRDGFPPELPGRAPRAADDGRRPSPSPCPSPCPWPTSSRPTRPTSCSPGSSRPSRRPSSRPIPASRRGPGRRGGILRARWSFRNERTGKQYPFRVYFFFVPESRRPHTGRRGAGHGLQDRRDPGGETVRTGRRTGRRGALLVGVGAAVVLALLAAGLSLILPGVLSRDYDAKSLASLRRQAGETRQAFSAVLASLEAAQVPVRRRGPPGRGRGLLPALPGGPSRRRERRHRAQQRGRPHRSLVRQRPEPRRPDRPGGAGGPEAERRDVPDPEQGVRLPRRVPAPRRRRPHARSISTGWPSSPRSGRPTSGSSTPCGRPSGRISPSITGTSGRTSRASRSSSPGTRTSSPESPGRRTRSRPSSSPSGTRRDGSWPPSPCPRRP
ncbi:MAG: hypothetical protein MZV70_52730 [Desulfobacterales bacterium]|nr:hypothetical protein [Desulfobacterales bacterium]